MLKKCHGVHSPLTPVAVKAACHIPCHVSIPNEGEASPVSYDQLHQCICWLKQKIEGFNKMGCKHCYSTCGIVKSAQLFIMFVRALISKIKVLFTWEQWICGSFFFLIIVSTETVVGDLLKCFFLLGSKVEKKFSKYLCTFVKTAEHNLLKTVMSLTHLFLQTQAWQAIMHYTRVKWPAKAAEWNDDCC